MISTIVSWFKNITKKLTFRKEGVNEMIIHQDELKDIEKTVSFLRQQLQSDLLSTSHRNEIEKLLSTIHRKREEGLLYIGIIGEFSVGKSTFLNALLKSDLLESHALGGTTTAITEIRYSEEPILRVSFTGKAKEKEYRLQGKSKQQINNLLKKYTAFEDNMGAIDKVNLYLTSDVLRRNIVLVDTPGVNVENKQHEIVTKEAIRKICDTFIVLISVDRPLPDSTIEFLQNDLSEHLDRCIFVLNKFDELRTQKDEEKMLKHIRMSLQKKLGIKYPLVFPLASLVVLNDFFSVEGLKVSEGKLQKSMEDFNRFESFLYDFTRKNSNLIILNKIHKATYTLSSDLSKLFLDQQRELHKEKQAISQNKLTELTPYLDSMKHISEYRMVQKLIEEQNEFYESLFAIQEEIRSYLSNRLCNTFIVTKKTSQEIEYNIKNFLSEQRLKKMMDTVVQEVVKEFEKIQQDNNEKIITDYRKLVDTIENFPMPNNTQLMPACYEQAGISLPAVDFIAGDHLSTAVKAALASLVIPFIGPVAGFIIGYIGSYIKQLFNQGDIENELNQKIGENLLKIYDESVIQYNKMVFELMKSFDKSIAQYHKKFGHKIDMIIETQEKRALEIKDISSTIVASIRQSMDINEDVYNEMVATEQSIVENVIKDYYYLLEQDVPKDEICTSTQLHSEYIYQCDRIKKILANGDAGEALKEYSKLLSGYDKRNYDLDYDFGCYYLDNKEYLKAIEYFNEVLFVKDNDYKSYHKRGMAYQELEDYDSALEDLSAAILIEPKSIPAYIPYFDILIDLERYKEITDKTYPIDFSSDASLSALYGSALYYVGNTKDGIKWVKQAVEIDPDHYDANLYLAELLLQEGEGDQLSKILGKIIKKEPKRYEGYSIRALLNIQLGKDKNEIVADIDKTLKLKPDIDDLYLFKGHLADTFEEQFLYYMKSLQVNPNKHTEINYSVSRLFFWEGSYYWSKYFLDRDIQSDPNNTESLLLRGLCNYYLEEYDEAYNDLKKVIKLDPDNAEAYHYLGLVYDSKGDVFNSKRSFLKATQIDDSYLDSFMSLGYISLGEGSYQNSIDYYSKVIAQDPKYAEAYYYRNSAYYSLEKYAEASKDMETYNRLLSNVQS